MWREDELSHYKYEDKFTYNFSRVSYPGYMEITCPHRGDEAYVYVQPEDWRNTLGRFIEAATNGNPAFKVSQDIWNEEKALQKQILPLQIRTATPAGYLVLGREEVNAALELAGKILRRIHYAEPPASPEEKEFLKPVIEESRFLGPFKRLLNDFNLASYPPETFEILKPIEPGYYLPPPC